ncbi:MAG TPA: hypothetical protein VIM87_15710, partial [Chitinophaga sp.]|uniref:hypothetical protein n=1 Tax=Chitinophaga sp. TaxID=1869181 RepID=UPI002F93974B
DEAYGLPKISYDFQAPIGEFGQVREGFHRLKLLHFFLQDFGDQLAPMVTVLPENARSLQPENITALRYAVRIKDNSGYLFLNNFQDDTTMLPQTNIQIKVQTPGGVVAIPASGGFSLASGENAVFPFNLDLNGALLRYSTAQLMMKGSGPSPYYVFFTPDGVKGECLFAAGVRVKAGAGAKVISTGNGTRVECTDRVASFTVSAVGKTTDVLIIDKARALTAYVMNIAGKRHIAFSSAVILQDSESFELLQDSVSQFGLSFYPRLHTAPKLENGSITQVNGPAVFSSFQVTLPNAKAAISVRQISEKKFVVTLPDTLPAGVNDLRLKVAYIGDSGMGFINGELVTDEFYNGIPWEIGLRKFLTASPKPSEMVLYFRPMQKNASYLIDLQPYPQSIPDFGDQHTYLKVDSITLSAEYKTTLSFR